MAINLSFHSTQKVTLKKNEVGGTTWYNVYLHMRHYGPEAEIIQDISIFCDTGVTAISPFEEMWQKQEAERLAKEKRVNDEKDETRRALDAVNARSSIQVEFGTDPDLAAELVEGTSPVNPDDLVAPVHVNALEEEHINVNR